MSENEPAMRNAVSETRSDSWWSRLSRDRIDHVFDIISTVLLSLGALATAWSGYQAARWDGVQASSYSEASQLRVESSRASTRAGQQQAIDVGLFTSWLNSYVSGNPKLEEFHRQRFRPEFK